MVDKPNEKFDKGMDKAQNASIDAGDVWLSQRNQVTKGDRGAVHEVEALCKSPGATDDYNNGWQKKFEAALQSDSPQQLEDLLKANSRETLATQQRIAQLHALIAEKQALT